MLSMMNVDKKYRTELVETQALRDFSFEVDEGEFVAVTGPSGVGKSTFLNIAGLLEHIDSGQYFIDGVNASDLNDDQASQLRNEKIGFIFQSFNLIPELNLFDNVEVPLRYRGVGAAARKERVEHALETVGLAGRMKHFPSQLSGGQQQRVAIARALVGEPKILLADEPTGNLDSVMATQVMELLEALNKQGSTIVMVTHDAELAQRAKRRIHMLDGKVDLDEINEKRSPESETPKVINS